MVSNIVFVVIVNSAAFTDTHRCLIINTGVSNHVVNIVSFVKYIAFNVDIESP